MENKNVSSLNLNKEIVAESKLLQSSFREIKSNPPAKSNNDFFMRPNQNINQKQVPVNRVLYLLNRLQNCHLLPMAVKLIFSLLKSIT